LANTYQAAVGGYSTWLSFNGKGTTNMDKQDLQLYNHTLKDLELIDKIIPSTAIILLVRFWLLQLLRFYSMD